MTQTVLRKSIYIKASQETVWDWLTQPEKLGQWFHKPKTVLKEGAPLEMFGAQSGDKLIWGDVRVAREPDYLEYTFTIKPMGDLVSVVKWTLETVPGGTRLSLVHEGLAGSADAFDLTLSLDKGWEEHMARLRDGIHESAS